LAAGLVICCYAVKLIKIKFGFLVTVIFVVSLLSFVCARRNHDESKKAMHTLKFQGGRPGLSFEESLDSWHIPDRGGLGTIVTAGKYR
jgi:hypothetical protein